MESSQQVPQIPLVARLWAFLFLAIGLFRLADWLHGNRHDWGLLLSGVGFLLMAPGAHSIGLPKATTTVGGNARLLLVLSVAGAALVAAAIAKHWL